jgi:hypothetical protein
MPDPKYDVFVVVIENTEKAFVRLTEAVESFDEALVDLPYNEAETSMATITSAARNGSAFDQDA